MLIDLEGGGGGGKTLTTDLALLVKKFCGQDFVIRRFAAFCAARLVKCVKINT